MSSATGLETHQIQLSIRFVQGYRYLDRCGETLIRLENALSEGWIPQEPSPTSGALRNDLLGMTVSFNSEAMTVQQREFLAFEHFRDQACTLYETLWQTLEIARVHAPALRLVLQKGFHDGELEEAGRYVLNLKLCIPRPEILSLLGGLQTALDFTVVTSEELSWNDVLVQQRRRLNVSVVRQEKQPPFDTRLLQRAKLLPERQRDALQALLRLKRSHPDIAPVAAQMDLENSFETEFDAKGFDLPSFLEQSWTWAETVRNQLSRL